MAAKRRSFEEGHRRKFLVVVDETPECERAILYAAKRAQRTGGVLVMLSVVVDADFRSFLGVEQMMRAEARAEAETMLAKMAGRAVAAAGIEPELAVREGTRAEAIASLIEEDEDIAILVLAAGTGADGPGPLVTSLAGRLSGTFAVPVTIVPGGLSEEEIAALA